MINFTAIVKYYKCLPYKKIIHLKTEEFWFEGHEIFQNPQFRTKVKERWIHSSFAFYCSISGHGTDIQPQIKDTKSINTFF